MAQQINVFWYNSFVNPMQSPLLCRNSRAVALAQLGLTAGWLADRRNEDKFQISKIHYKSNFYIIQDKSLAGEKFGENVKKSIWRIKFGENIKTLTIVVEL